MDAPKSCFYCLPAIGGARSRDDSAALAQAAVDERTF